MTTCEDLFTCKFPSSIPSFSRLALGPEESVYIKNFSQVMRMPRQVCKPLCRSHFLEASVFHLVNELIDVGF